MRARDVRLAEVAWPYDRIGEALFAVATRCGLPTRTADVTRTVPPSTGEAEWLPRAVNRFADWLGVDAEAVSSTYGEMPAFVAASSPGIVALPGGGLLAVVRTTGRTVELLAPDLRSARMPAAQLTAVLRAPLERPVEQAVSHVLDAVAVPSGRRGRAQASLCAERLSGARIDVGWLLRLPAGRPMREQVRRAGLAQSVVLLLLSHTTQYVILLGAWWMLGRGALDGRIDIGWLAAWSLAILMILPLRAYSTRAQGAMTIQAGVLLKRRWLAGVLKLNPEEIRSEGPGRLLGRVLEAESLESLAAEGGFASALALVELALGASVLLLGSAPSAELWLLVAWTAASAAAFGMAHRARRAWTDARLALANDLVENIVGQRTRLAQESPGAWHDHEDRLLSRTLGLGRLMDRLLAALLVIAPRGWLVVSLGVAALMTGPHSSTSLGVTVGGALLVQAALQRALRGAAALGAARLAWVRVRDLSVAAGREVPPGSPHACVREPGERARGDALIELRNVMFSYPGRGVPALNRLSLHIASRDRVLLEGVSGGGKSTLAAIAAGLRSPQGGLVLVDGLDPKTLGPAAWRRRVATAPQFHENHVLGATFGFNLLMGRRWPPRPEDVAEALAVCSELSLGPLLERMPGGLTQMVGETGWQLSHGEKSRLFVARALLQGAELVVLDESLAALDARTMRGVVECVVRRANAVLLIAHP